MCPCDAVDDFATKVTAEGMIEMYCCGACKFGTACATRQHVTQVALSLCSVCFKAAAIFPREDPRYCKTCVAWAPLCTLCERNHVHPGYHFCKPCSLEIKDDDGVPVPCKGAPKCQCLVDSRIGGHCCLSCSRGLPCPAQSHKFSTPQNRKVPKAACARQGCPCDSFDGNPSNYCSIECQNGVLCGYKIHSRSSGYPDPMSDPLFIGPIALKLDPQDPRYQARKKMFENTWAASKGNCPKVVAVFLVAGTRENQKRFDDYEAKIKSKRGIGMENVRPLWHGTPLDPKCTLYETGTMCDSTRCGICGITRNGFDPDRIGKGKLSQAWKPGSGFKRFGYGFYFAYNSSKSHDYAAESHVDLPNGRKRRCLMICRVVLGVPAVLKQNAETLRDPPDNKDSVVGEVDGKWLNFPEACVYEADCCVARYVVFYEGEANEKW